MELVAGIVHDPLFGSLVMLGLGGVHTDVFADRSLRLVPVTDTDAAGMWTGLRAARLLTGYRGAPPVGCWTRAARARRWWPGSRTGPTGTPGSMSVRATRSAS